MAEADASSFRRGFEKTCTDAFDAIATHIPEIVRTYNELKDEPDYTRAILYMKKQHFCEAREDVIDSLRIWYEKSGQMIATYPDERTEKRIRKVHELLETAKEELRLTRPLGEDEEEDEDMEGWLQRRDTAFPVEIVPASALIFKPRPAGNSPKSKAKQGCVGDKLGSPITPRAPMRSSTPNSEFKGGFDLLKEEYIIIRRYERGETSNVAGEGKVEREMQWKDLEKTPITGITFSFSPSFNKREIRMWSSDNVVKHQTISRKETLSRGGE